MAGRGHTLTEIGSGAHPRNSQSGEEWHFRVLLHYITLSLGVGVESIQMNVLAAARGAGKEGMGALRGLLRRATGRQGVCKQKNLGQDLSP